VQFFSNEFSEFFNGLEKNNNRDWFNQNKNVFIKSVKEPFEVFIEALLNEIKEIDENIVLSPKEAIFRIYKDVRFSKDKLPYKTFVSAIISEGGRKDLTSPGIYIEMSKDGIKFYGGAHFLEREQLQKLREFISDNLDEFYSLIGDKIFKKNFGTILGDQNKRIPGEFKELQKAEPLIANKQFYFFKKMDSKKILSKYLVKQMMELYNCANPLIQFFKIGMNSN
jgi:uncharacterized protein (TIGR02453 family)